MRGQQIKRLAVYTARNRGNIFLRPIRNSFHVVDKSVGKEARIFYSHNEITPPPLREISAVLESVFSSSVMAIASFNTDVSGKMISLFMYKNLCDRIHLLRAKLIQHGIKIKVTIRQVAAF